MYYKVAPSVLAADFAELGSQLRAVSEAGAEWIHLDVMDGAFVPSISFGMPVIKSIRRVTDRVFDVHMMVEEPGRYVEDVKKAGADVITVHAEACKHLDRVISQIKEAGCRAGVALNPATPVSVLEHILDQVDMVLIMTVNPGFGGQKFIPYTIEKVKAVRRLCDERGLTTDIQVDGGISAANVREVLEAGANIFVAGTSTGVDRFCINNPSAAKETANFRRSGFATDHICKTSQWKAGETISGPVTVQRVTCRTRGVKTSTGRGAKGSRGIDSFVFYGLETLGTTDRRRREIVTARGRIAGCRNKSGFIGFLRLRGVETS